MNCIVPLRLRRVLNRIEVDAEWDVKFRLFRALKTITLIEILEILTKQSIEKGKSLDGS
jgi:hypothetical protein